MSTIGKIATYRIIDGDGERITKEHYNLVNSIITKNFPSIYNEKEEEGIEDSSVPVIINAYRINEGIVVVNYFQKETRVSSGSVENLKEMKRNFRSKTKLKLEEIN